jgi:signal transduction histidine kinase
MVPFKQGMLYVGSAEKLTSEQIELVKSLADAFSVAYARYEDFKQLEEAKGRIENTLSELKSTQTQLIQSEKMASLGELTAGIAHEIQNPLNFVTNFSEVSGELTQELKDERLKLKAERDESLEKEILDDIAQNLEKINHHGQRASGIVKGMLEHSRTGSGEKELTDINKLADEYLRLSYHGLRAKDKSFNADFKTDFDESLSKVKVITQDLGRVILNLINNAFYACTERRRSTDSKDYKPTVTVTTRKIGDKIEISVKDNGAGIPDDIKEKIFQPFFTTKPTGSGTGLGLSMSYDIVTKGHGGELKVVTEEGEGTEFIILLKG